MNPFSVKNYLGLIGLGLLYSAAIGLFSFIFLQVEHHVIHVIWHTIAHLLGQWYSVLFVVLLVAGVFGLRWLNANVGKVPYTAHEVQHVIDIQGERKQYHVAMNTIATLLVLILGAGVGPEATLLGVVVGLSTFQVDKMRYYYYHRNQLVKLPFKQKVAWFFSTNLRDISDQRVTENQKQLKAFKLLFILNGLMVFAILSKLRGGSSFATLLGDKMWQMSDLIWVPVGVVFALLLAVVYRFFNRLIEKLFKHDCWLNTKYFVGALAIFIVYIINQDLLFSGQSVVSVLADKGLQASTGMLVLYGVLKLGLLSICLHTGWKGGDIFPLLFSAALFGFALAQVLPGANYLVLLATIISAFLVFATGHVVVAVLFTAMFFPATYGVLIIFVVLLIASLKKVFSPAKATA